MTAPSPRPPITYVIRKVQYVKIRGAHSVDAALEIAETLDEGWTVGEYDLFTEYEEQP